MPETSLSLLEQLCRQRDADAWDRVVGIYTPVLQSWLRQYEELSSSDVDDLVQDVLLAVSQELPKFEHNNQRGAFRNWLRTILVNRLRYFWRSRQNRPTAIGGSDFLDRIEKLQDDGSELSGIWDREHDRHVMQQLLKLAEPNFSAHIWHAFSKQVLEEKPASAVADELDMSLTAVYAAKSRVLSTLRTLAEGLIS